MSFLKWTIYVDFTPRLEPSKQVLETGYDINNGVE